MKSIFKKLTSLILVVSLANILVACQTNTENTGIQTEENTSAASVAEASSKEKSIPQLGTRKDLAVQNESSDYVALRIKDGGDIVLKLEPQSAPITVANFQKLVEEKFYDGLTFHRIIPGFVVQGGDPLGNGTGGSEEKIKGEFLENGVNNSLKHVRGAISMARASDPNSASSQFFIVLSTEGGLSLNGKYAVFGEVIDGMDVVDAFATLPTNEVDAPVDYVPTIEEAVFLNPEKTAEMYAK